MKPQIRKGEAMKCPVKKCALNPLETYRCRARNKCQLEAWSIIRRAQRLIREADGQIPDVVKNTRGYESWKRRAVEIGAIQKEK